MQYVPVFRGNNFEGKYAVKIIVKQGDPSQVYLISEKIKFMTDSNTKTDEIEVHYAYERDARDANGTTEFKGVELMNLIHAKASQNSKVSVFHDGCNPEPPYLELEVRTFRFTNINSTQYTHLEIMYVEYFEQMEIDFNTNFDKEAALADLELEEGEDVEKVKKYIVDNVSSLNFMFRDTDNPTGVRRQRR